MRRSILFQDLKNSFSARSPNFPHRKLKMLGIEFRFDRKMRPSKESQPSIGFLSSSKSKFRDLDQEFWLGKTPGKSNPSLTLSELEKP